MGIGTALLLLQRGATPNLRLSRSALLEPAPGFCNPKTSPALFVLPLLFHHQRGSGMQAYLAIAIGGILGCWARYFMTNLIQTLFGRDFPYATLSINVLGSFVMGFLFVLTLERLVISSYVRLGVLTGFVGGFTTFSTFTMETLLLAEQGESGKAAAYVVLSVGLGVAAAIGGAYIARNI